MYKKIVAFSAIFALLFSGCADKSAGVKKIDEDFMRIMTDTTSSATNIALG